MRISSYILLFLAFATGVAASFGVASVFFWKKPAPKHIAVAKPTIQVIVAKNDIPAGTRMHASLVRYLAAPIDEVPEQAIVNFRHLDNMKSRLDIVQGCPICPDMLQPATDAREKSDVFVPPGYRIVPIRIDKSRGDADLSPGSRTNIVVVPRRRSGDLVEKRNAVLRLDSTEQRKMLLENVTVHSVQTTLASSEDKGLETRVEEVSLLLTQADFEKVLAANHEGRLRLTPITKPGEPVVAELAPEELRVETVKSTEKPAVADVEKNVAQSVPARKDGDRSALEDEERPEIPNNLVQANDVDPVDGMDDKAINTRETGLAHLTAPGTGRLPNPENLARTQPTAQVPEPLRHLLVDENSPTASAHRVLPPVESPIGFVLGSPQASGNGNDGVPHQRVSTNETAGVSFVAPRSGVSASARTIDTASLADTTFRSQPRGSWQPEAGRLPTRADSYDEVARESYPMHGAPGIDVIRAPRVPQRSSYNPFNMGTGNSQ